VGNDGQRIKRFQYTAIDDATRIRALRVYDRHTQRNTIDFMDYVGKVERSHGADDMEFYRLIS
jgi:DNA phosphorothioation-dependent restriction protein DptG